MLTVKSVSKNYQINIICNRINNILNSCPDFWKEVLSHTDNFLYANINGPQLYQFYHDSKTIVEVHTYKSKNPWSKSNGYTKPEYPNKMWLNTRKLNRSEASIGCTIGHETVHNLDAAIPLYSFGHRENEYTPEKDACAPQWFGDLLYKYLSGGILSASLPHEEKFIV